MDRPPHSPWKLAVESGAERERWRSVEQLLDLPPDELDGPDVPPERGARISFRRRELLQLMGASLALAGAAGCPQVPPREEIVPAVDARIAAPLGERIFYASTSVRAGYGTGILLETHAGRPTKIEGNPAHPMSLGKSSAWEQALLLQLYDPGRARGFTRAGSPMSFPELITDFRALRDELARTRGEGLHVVLPPTSSLVLAGLLDGLRSALPRMQVHFLSPHAHANVWTGARRAFGRVVEPVYDLTKAAVVVSLDDELFTDEAAGLRQSHDFAWRRRSGERSLLFVADDGASLASQNADRRLSLRPSRVTALASALYGGDAHALNEKERAFLDELRREIDRDPSSTAVLVGDRQPPEVHAFAHALHQRFGAAGKTVNLVPSPILEAGAASHDPWQLFTALDAGAVDVLMTFDVNVAYHWPRAALARAKQRFHHSLYVDETAVDALWFIPAAHPLESWGDARAVDGTLSPIQPAVEPLWSGRSTEDVLAALVSTFTGYPPESGRGLVATAFQRSGIDLEQTLRQGFAEGSPFPPVKLDVQQSLHDGRARATSGAPFELSLRPDAKIGSGEMADVSWLLELPDPVSKLTWENAVLLSPGTAARLDLEDGSMVEIIAGARVVRGPVVVVPGHADDVVSTTTGWGHAADGMPLAHGLGFSASDLVDPGTFGAGVDLRVTGEKRRLAVTQRHQTLDSAEKIAVEVDLVELAQGGTPPELVPEKLLSLYSPPVNRPGVPQWGMTVDLDICTGCSSCVVACQAENNIPVVGRNGVLEHREMHWLRIDRYYRGTVGEPEVLHQPMLCQHCEMAPCEYVCPVNATVHSDDGLNEMVYNRCVGTRFCSNNCPYKVRRFNWFNYNRAMTPVEGLAKNPDVTVRERGVMEKCTYCVQRIRRVEVEAKLQEREIKDGEVVTACQQSCPTNAIVFGRIDDPGSQVAKLYADRRTYQALEDLGVRPRTRYLAKVRR